MNAEFKKYLIGQGLTEDEIGSLNAPEKLE
jgi:hypothetical protein